MFYFAIAAMMAVGGSSSTAGPAASPAPAATAAPAAGAAASGPLREIVYKVAQTDSSSGTASDYGGTDTGSRSGWDQGTLTIDVLQVLSDDILAVHASEAWNSLGGKPFAATGYVASDGTLSLVSGTYSAVMLTLLPYVASGFIASHNMTLGTAWTLSGDADKVHYEHHYAVTKIDGADVTISIDGQMTGSGMGMFPTIERDTVVYRPSLLVPISGDFSTRTRSSTGAEDSTVSHNLHFQRVSDTRETSGTATH
jgi:hypothetical protein